MFTFSVIENKNSSSLILLKVTFESQSNTLKSFDLSCKLEKSKVHNLLYFSHLSSVITSYLYLLPLITRKIASFTVKESFSHLHSMVRDDMFKDGQKILPMHVTLKAVVGSIVNTIKKS